MRTVISEEKLQPDGPGLANSVEHTAVLIPVASIRVVKNTRKYIDPERLANLAADIKKNGLQQPITVAATPEIGNYELIYGERRYRAHQLNEAEVIPAFVRTDLTQEQIQDIRRAENLQHVQISPIDEAEDFAEALQLKSIEELAATIHHPVRFIRERLSLLNLIDTAKTALRTGKIGLDIAKILACLSPERQRLILDRVEAEGLNARKLANLLAETDLNLQRAPFDTAECHRCPHNSAGQPDLFAREASGLGHCLNAPCWRKKEEAKALEVVRQIEASGPRAMLTEKTSIDLSDLPADITQDKVIFHLKEEIGERQLQDCASCNFLFAFVSKRGQILKQKICTMKACYEAKRKEFHEENKTDQKIQGKAKTGRAKGTKPSPGRSPSTQQMSPRNAPLRVREFKKQVYRRFLAEQMRKTPQNALLLLLLAMYHARWSRFWKGDVHLKEYGITVTPPEGDISAFFESLRTFTAEALIDHGGALATKVLSELPLNLTEELVYSHLGATAEQIFTVDRAYYELLTKSEIEATVKEMGLDKFLQIKNQSLSKLLAKPKNEFIKSLIGVGFIPERMPAWLQRETDLKQSEQSH